MTKATRGECAGLSMVSSVDAIAGAVVLARKGKRDTMNRSFCMITRPLLEVRELCDTNKYLYSLFGFFFMCLRGYVIIVIYATINTSILYVQLPRLDLHRFSTMLQF